MTDPSTARALVEKAARIALHWTPPVGGFDGYNATTAHRVCREIAERIEALTPPEGDTLSDEVMKASMVAIVASGQQRGLRPSQIVAEILADEDVSAALQSRVSPQEGLREALGRRRNIYLAKRNASDALAAATDNAWERYNFAAEAVEWVAGDLGVTLPEIPDDPAAALTASRMSEDATK